MPMVENKVTKKRVSLSDEQWETMKKNIIPGSDGDGGPGRSFASKYKVVDPRTAAEKTTLIPAELRSTPSAASENADVNDLIQKDAARRRRDTRADQQ